MSGSTFDVAVTIPQEMILSGNIAAKDVLRLAVPECLSKLAERTALLATSEATSESVRNELRDTHLKAIRQLTSQSAELGIIPDQSTNGLYETARRALGSQEQLEQTTPPSLYTETPLRGRPLDATFIVSKDEILAGKLDGEALLKKALNAAESKLAAHAELVSKEGADSPSLTSQIPQLTAAYQRLSVEKDRLHLPHNAKTDAQMGAAKASWTGRIREQATKNHSAAAAALP